MMKLSKQSMAFRISNMLDDLPRVYASRLTDHIATRANNDVDPKELDLGERFFYFSTYDGSVIFCQRGKNGRFYGKESWDQANRSSNEIHMIRDDITYLKHGAFKEIMEFFNEVADEVKVQVQKRTYFK